MNINFSEKIIKITQFDVSFLNELPVEYHSEYLLKLLQLHPKHYPAFIQRLELFSNLNENALNALLEIGAYIDVMKNKKCFAKLSDQKLAELLLREAADLLAENIRLFENLELNIGLAIIENKDGFMLEESLESFKENARKILWEKLKE